MSWQVARTFVRGQYVLKNVKNSRGIAIVVFRPIRLQKSQKKCRGYSVAINRKRGYSCRGYNLAKTVAIPWL